MPTQPPRSLWTDRDDDRQWQQTAEMPAAAPAAPAPPPPPRRSRRRWLLVPLIALLVGGIGAGGFFLGKELQSDPQAKAAAKIELPTITGRTQETRANQIYAQVKSGVVQIKTSSGSGTGFVVDKTGVIVTNAHVVDTATKVEVYFNDAKTPVAGVVTARDVSWDLATVKVSPRAAKLVPLGLADSDQVEPGDSVLAIGYPLGLDQTLTQGIVSGLGRHIDAQNGFSIDKVIQTDASINPGNSGGPLIDGRGRVIGVNSQIATLAAGSNTGIGFAIPSNTVREAVTQLAAGKAVPHPYLGVSLGDSKAAGGGADIGDVTAGAPAAAGGLKAGDVVTKLNDQPVRSGDDLITLIATKKVGDTVHLTVQRDGKEMGVDVKLGDRPKQAPGTSSQPSDGQDNPFTLP